MNLLSYFEFCSEKDKTFRISCLHVLGSLCIHSGEVTQGNIIFNSQWVVCT